MAAGVSTMTPRPEWQKIPDWVTCPKCWEKVDRNSRAERRRYYMSCPHCRGIIEFRANLNLLGSRPQIDQENCRHCGTMKEIGRSCPSCGKSN